MSRLAVLTALAVTAASCIGDPPPSSSSSSTSTSSTSPSTTVTTLVASTTWVADPDFTLSIGVSGPPVFDPILKAHMWADDHSSPYGLVEQPSLYRLVPPTSTVVPHLAAEAEPPVGRASDDGWLIDIRLRPWVMWNDGTSVDAADVAYSFEVMQGTNRWNGLPASNNLQAVEVVDPSTVRLVWERRPTVDEWQLGVALDPIISVDFWRGPSDRPDPPSPILDLDPATIPTTGPYRVGDVSGQDAWELEAVSGWWEAGSSWWVWHNGAVRYVNPTVGIDETYGEPIGELVAEWTVGPYASTVEYRVFGDAITRHDALSNGDIDLVFGPLSIGFDERTAGIGVATATVTSRAASGYWVAFDTGRPPFDSLAARRAAVCGFDRQFLANDVLLRLVLASEGWDVGLGSWSTEATTNCETTPTQDVLGDGFITTFAFPPDLSPIADTAALWIANWLKDLGAEAGATLTWHPGNRGVMFSWLGPGELAVLGAGIDPVRLGNDHLELIPEITGWESAEFQTLIEQMKTANDIDAAQAALSAVVRLLAHEVPAVPLLHRTVLEVFNPDVITPPFLTGNDDRFVTDLLGGLQAWEHWVTAAIRPSGG